jgi:hypothetical protein
MLLHEVDDDVVVVVMGLEWMRMKFCPSSAAAHGFAIHRRRVKQMLGR